MASKTRAGRGGEDGEKAGGRGGDGATGAVTFLVGGLIAAYLFFTNPDPKSPESYWFINTGLCLWLPLVTILLFLRSEPSQFGMTRGDRRLGLKWTLIAWVVMVVVLAVTVSIPSLHSQFQNQYLFGRLSSPLEGVGPVFNRFLGHVNLKALLFYELAMGFYMFCWEFFFRGFLLFGLQKSRLGAWGAVIVQALLFALLHWSVCPRCVQAACRSPERASRRANFGCSCSPHPLVPLRLSGTLGDFPDAGLDSAGSVYFQAYWVNTL